MTEDEILVNEIKQEIEPIFDYLVYHVGQNKLSLKSKISFQNFNKYFPHITKDRLIAFFGYCEQHPKATKQAIKEIQKKE